MMMPSAVSAGSDRDSGMTHAPASLGLCLKLIVAFPPAVFAAIIASRSEQSVSQVPSFVSVTFVTRKEPAARATGGFSAATASAHNSTRMSDHARERWLRIMRALLSPDHQTLNTYYYYQGDYYRPILSHCSRDISRKEVLKLC